ncbi:MAG TPA: bifunctional methionine sulfoxide reductase B/A protein [Armatimonadota bacterium]|nr:bifunctional methionine sulfoxide reductase B/A protein [Armatimonadota bacterium]
MRADTTSVGLVAAVAVAVLAFVWVSRINARAQGGAGDTTPPGTATAEETRGEWRELTAEEKRIIVDKGTERAGTGEYDDHFAGGIYTCRRCGAMLYRSDDKFRSDCGWPAFDDEIPAAVTQTLDKGGVRTEITCANCEGHLGHVFTGEGLTAKNARHCVNSASMDFVPAEDVKYGRAIFAGGCFWGVEYWLQRQPGVLRTTAGYSGGHTENPTYEMMHQRNSGHAEAVEVLYDPARVTYEELAKVFFNTHDPTQIDGQGPDLGKEYRSAIFHTNEDQKAIAEGLIAELEERGLKVATQVVEAGRFWTGEDYHQDWYNKKGTPPSCHRYRPLWEESAPADAD